MQQPDLVLYRGPLERSRLRFLFECLYRIEHPLHVIWLFPEKLNIEKFEHAKLFFEEFNLENLIILNHSLKDILKTRKYFSNYFKKNNFSRVHLIGFSAPIFSTSTANASRFWYINGIPEEKKSSIYFDKLIHFLSWKAQSYFAKSNLVITVSARMSEYVKKRSGIESVFHAPTCTDLRIFNLNKNLSRKYFTYLGSGASWQALDLLEDVWYELFNLDKFLKFRVISRDPRCQILGKRLPKENIEFVSSDKFEDVANYLQESEVGFLLRRNHIINQVCFPTKLGEYLASGCWVVGSNINWDIKDYFSKYNIGILVDPELNSKIMASQILKYRLDNTFDNLSVSIKKCALELDKKFWWNKLKSKLDNY